MKDKNTLVEGIMRYIANPVAFVREILKAEPDEWQIEALKSLADKSRVAIRSGHGVGKTALESWTVCWFLFTRLYPKVVCTAPTQQQLYNILWPEISKWLKKSPILVNLFDYQKTKIYFKALPERWFATARTASTPENMAGFHEEHILFVVDEASGISDEIFEAVEGALTTKDAKLLICGNPTRNSGFFKRAFFEDRELYHTMKVSCSETKRVSNEYCNRLIKQYGEDSDVVRVRVLGEFPKVESDGLIALELIETSTMKDSEIIENELHVGVDVARFGNDETVIMPRIGNVVLNFTHYRKTDTMSTVGRIIDIVQSLMKKYSLLNAVIHVDDDGVGGGVTDRLNEVIVEKSIDATVVACHNGGRARDNEHYANWITEAWFGLKQRFVDGDITLPKDDELTAQLSTRKYLLNSRDQLIIEDKKTYKKRVGRSPDRADALVLAFSSSDETNISPPPPMLSHVSYWSGI